MATPEHSQPADRRPSTPYQDISDMYRNANNERHMEIFPGHFINFGYWRDLQDAPFTEETRIASQRNLYHLMFNKIGITHNTPDTLLEVACGKGKGKVYPFVKTSNRRI